MNSTQSVPWRLSLPLDKAIVGQPLHCAIEPHPENDAVFTDWECPLIWKWVSSRLKIDDSFEGRPALRFNFARRTPAEVWKTNWSLWYDTALTTRELPPDDLTLRATLTFEEVTCGYGSDNNSFVRPWTGIVARMVDLRRYYFFCLEYPDIVALYRREDATWTKLASRSCDLDPFRANTLELRIRGQWFQGFLDGKRLFGVADYAYDSGKAGLRATSESFVTEFSLEADEASVHRFQIQRKRADQELEEARAALPRAKIHHTLTLPEAACPIDMRVASFCDSQSKQIFYTLDDDPGGTTAILRDLQGREIWRSRDPHPLRYQVTTPGEDGCSDIVGFTREAVVLIDGKTGETRNRRVFSSLPDPPNKMAFMPDTMADLRGAGARRDFLFTAGANDPRIWALGPDFEDIWMFTAGSGMGHNKHVCVRDIDGDDRDEVFAGGSLINYEGREIWRQEELLRRLRSPNAGHVDAAQMGFFCEDPDLPVIHMQGSSAGHLVADARDGKTIVDHPQGHVQGGCTGRFVPGEPGIQVASSCRHGNYGILAIYSGEGRRLSRFQPDYKTDCPHSINWDSSGTDLLLIAKDPQRAGLYDWQGRRVVPLAPLLPEEYSANMPNKGRDLIATPLEPGAADSLIVRINKEMRFIRAER